MLSSALSKQWKALTEEEQKEWQKKAEAASQAHDGSHIYSNQEMLLDEIARIFEGVSGPGCYQMGNAAFELLYAYRDKDNKVTKGCITIRASKSCKTFAEFDPQLHSLLDAKWTDYAHLAIKSSRLLLSTVMSPASDTPSFSKPYKLKEDGSNWAVYRDRTTDHLKGKGLRSHLNGRVSKPIELNERYSESLNKFFFYLPSDDDFENPLESADVDKYELLAAEYDRNEGLGSDVLNNTIPTPIYREIHHLPTLALKWRALQAMFEHRGNTVQIDILSKLQSARYSSGSMRAFLSQLTEWRNDLLDNDYQLSDSQFVTYITSSVSTIPDYRMFISAIEGAAEVTGTTITLEVLKKRLIAEHEARNGINSNATTSGSGSAALAASRSKDGKGGKKKRKNEYHCTICNISGHSKERCYAEGGGRHDQAPEWYKKKQAERLAQEMKNANAATTTSSNVKASYTCVVEGVTRSFNPIALSAAKAPDDYQGIILDCGASDHFTPYRHLLTNFVELCEHTRVADNRATYVEGRGTMVVEIPMGKGQPPTTLTLTSVYCVPSFVFTLISTTRMDLAGYSILQKGGISTIRAPDDTIIGRVPLVRGLYRVTDPTGGSDGSGPLRANATTMSLMDFHIVMGHRSFGDLRRMIEGGMIEGIKVKDLSGTPPVCRTCIEAKAIRKPFKESKSPHPTTYAQEISTDVWGPASVESIGRKNYFVLFIDRFSHETRAFFLRNKSDAFDAYQRYEAWVHVQRDAKIKVLRSDRGGEYIGAEFTSHLEHNGTVRKLTTHNSPQSNGIAERAMGVHVSTARALLIQSKLPTFLWAEAIRFSVWLHNRQFTTSVPTLKTPFEIVTGKKPDLSTLHPWGAKVLVKDLKAGKLQSRVREGHYLGPDEEALGSRIYWEGKRTITVEREVFFDIPDMGSVSVEGETGSDDETDEFVYLFNNSTSHSQTKLHFPQEDDDEPGEYAADIDSPPTPPSDPPPPQPTSYFDEDEDDDEIPELMEDSDNEDDEEDGDDEEIERELLQEDGDEREGEGEGGLPVVPEPVNEDVPMPGHFSAQEPTTSTCTRRNVAPPPGFYSESNQEARGRGVNNPQPYTKDATLAALIAEIDETLGQEGASVGSSPGLVSALAMALAANQGSDDPTYEEAMSGSDKEKWMEAIREEVAQIEKMQTYEIVEVDRRNIPNIIGSRFVLRQKWDAQGNISRYKARLVGKGYSQRPGIDFNETFAPTIRPVTLRLILALGATMGSAIEQGDAKNAYLNGILPPNEIIYMQPHPILYKLHPTLVPRREQAKAKGKILVLRLWRPLYGTKQGGNKWYEELCFVLLKLGLNKSKADHALFYRFKSPTEYCLLGVATDDFTFVADSTGTVKKLKGEMGKHMELAEMGELSWILGVDVRRDLKARTITLSQTAYINHILERFGMLECKNASTPLEPHIDLTPGSEHVSSTLLSPKKKSEYRELVGLLMYLSVMTRPDLASALAVLARYLEQPHTTHMEAGMHVIRYIKATRDFRLTLGGKDFVLSGYSDANWGTELHRHSISGYTFSTGAGVISWSSKKQPIITLSSTESEYVALTHAAKEAKWLRTLTREILPVVGLGAYVEKFNPTVLYCDNQGAIKLSTNPVFHAHTKHIDIHFHYIQQTITSRDLQLVYCPTDSMVADIMTKQLARVKFTQFRRAMGVLGPEESVESDARIEGEC
ncbi:hypothetical protein H1R20_g7604, partial [Candolleomyces eurysporus]